MMADDASASARATHEIRLVQPADLPSVCKLLPELDGDGYDQRFPGQTCADFIQWKYFSNPAGDAAVGVALDGERVVSIVAGTPKRVRRGSETVLAFELGDFITAADHRKRGLFSALINLVCDAAQQRGAAFVYVRPNEMSFPILASRLAFTEPGQIESRHYTQLSSAIARKLGAPEALTRALGVDAVARKLAVPRASAAVRVESIDGFGDEVDQLWMRTRDLYSFCLVRDRQYLNWRYADCPTPYRRWVARRNGDLAGYLVAFVSSRQPIATILDLFTHPEDEEAAAALLGGALDEMLRTGTQAIYTWTLHAGPEIAASRLLKRACALVQKPLLHFAMRPLMQQMRYQGLPASGRHVAAGDFDGF